MSAALRAAVGVLALAYAAAARPSEPSLLLDYASSLRYTTQPHESENRRRLARLSHQLEQDPPPAADCAHTLGAARFTNELVELGSAQAALGDAAAAVAAYERALECTPHAVYLLARLGQQLTDAGQYGKARTVLTRALARQPDNVSAAMALARLDVIEERWADALPRLRWLVMRAFSARAAADWSCLLWVAERRAHVPPEAPARTLGDDWSRTLLQALQDGSEARLISHLEREPLEESRRQELLEALYCVAERRLADGDTAIARRYLAAAVNLKMPARLEHHMALAELTRMQ